jgi:preprotein translocase subunit SecF
MFAAKYTKQFLIAAAAIFIIGFAIVGALGLPLGIDFTGGALTEVSYDERPEREAIESALESIDVELGQFSVRRASSESGRDGFILRTRDLTEDERQTVEGTLLATGGGGAVERFTSVGPVIGEELKTKAVWAIGGVVLITIFYVAFVFRRVSEPVSSWVYGLITILALIHDVLVPTAVLSVLGYLIGAEADVLFVMALLAVLGYSVNDTIVVFDRVRENLMKYRQEKKVKKDGEEVIEYIYTKPFESIVGESVSQTLTRSINTSLTTFLAVFALYVFGGEVTQLFALILMAGIVAGTYSSICIANPLLIAIGKRNLDAKINN